MAAAAREGSSLQRGTSSRSVPLFSFPPSRLVRASSRRGPHAAEGPVGPAACPQGSSSSPGDPLGTKVLWAQGAEPVPLLPRRMQASDARVWYLRSPITPAAAGGCGNVSFPQLRAAALLLFKHAEQEPSLQPQLSPPCPVPALPGPSAAPNSEDFTHFGDCKPRLSASPAPCRAASSSSSVVETKRGSHRCS